MRGTECVTTRPSQCPLPPIRTAVHYAFGSVTPNRLDGVEHPGCERSHQFVVTLEEQGRERIDCLSAFERLCFAPDIGVELAGRVDGNDEGGFGSVAP
jgi:hypothetical protein